MKLVVAPNYLHRSILEYYRKDNPFNDVKIVSVTDLKNATGYLKKDSALIYLMKEKHYSYDEAKMYLSILTYNLDEDIVRYEELKSLQDELIEKGHLYRLYHLKPLLYGKNALVIGYQKDDRELNYFANKLNLSLEFNEFAKCEKSFELKIFSQLEEEVYYVLNEIAHDLDNGVNIKDIIIVRRESTYDYYLNRLVGSFGYQINLPNSVTYYQTGVFSLFDELVKKHHDFALAIEELTQIVKDDELSLDFIDAVKRNLLDEDFDFAYDYLVNRLKDIKVRDNRYYPAIEVLEDFPYVTNKRIYVLGFAQGNYPSSGKDTSFLSSVDKEKLHLNLIKDETRFDQENIIDFLSLDNEYFLSFARKSLSKAEYQFSPILNEISCSKKDNPREKYIYSRVTLNYLLTAAKDKDFFYKEKTRDLALFDGLINSEYKTYDNQFTGVKAIKKNDNLKLSYSSVNDYFECPYKYYLKHVLDLDPFSESNSTILGNIVHETLENSLDMDLDDLSNLFDKRVNESNADTEIKIIWKCYVKKSTFKAVNMIKKHIQYMKNPSFEMEKKYRIKLDDNTVVDGKIDKTIFVDDKYIFVIDYKTGSSGDFNKELVDYGLSLQLPTYAYLLSENIKKKKYVVSGLYINHVLPKSRFPEVKDDALVEDYLKLSGITTSDINAIAKFDSTIADGASSFIKSVKIIKKDGRITGTYDQSYFDNLIELAKNKYIEANQRIRNNEFEISPYQNKKDNGCQFCDFKDICYVRFNQYRNISKAEGDESDGL